MDFTSKNVVFVAGLGGIGYETCKLLVKNPIATLFVLDVIENSNAVSALQSLNSKCKVNFIKFDITDKKSIQDAIKIVVNEVKFIDILVNGAGVLLEGNYERMINVNLTGLITTTYEALPYMDKQRNGRGGLIANIASVAGLDPIPFVVAYSTSKFGVIGFTRAMADPFYFNLTGVAVTAICPGFTETPLKNNSYTNYTFDYSKVLAERYLNVKTQTAANCAEHFLRIIQANKNGSIWISDGNLQEVELNVYWTPKLN